MGRTCGPQVSSQIEAALTTVTQMRGNNKVALQPKRMRMVTNPLKKRCVEVAVSSAEHSSFTTYDNDRISYVGASHSSPIHAETRYVPSFLPLLCAASCNLPSRSFTINISLGHSARTMCSSRSLAASSTGYRNILSTT